MSFRNPIARWTFAHPSRIAVTYLVVGIAWIIFSDRAVMQLAGDSPALQMSTVKGIGFVVVTGVALYLLLQVHYRIQRGYERALEGNLQRKTEIAAFLEANPSPVVELGAGGRLLTANSAAILAASASGMEPHALLPATTSAIVEYCLARREPWNERIVAGTRSYQWWFFPVPGSNRVFAYAIDDTESEDLKTRLVQAERLETIGHVARGIAHDFGNSLTAISTAVDLLEESALGPDAKDDVRTIRIAAQHAGELVSQLRALSRGEGRIEVIDLAEEVRAMEPLLRHLVRPSVKLIVNAGTSTARVRMDRAQFGRCLANLVANANDAIDDSGEVEICIGCDPGSPEIARIRVRDNGAGMDDATIEHIFEPLFTTKAERGTGLGLATVWNVVHEHGGSVEVNSAPGEGSSFLLSLPIAS